MLPLGRLCKQNPLRGRSAPALAEKLVKPFIHSKLSLIGRSQRLIRLSRIELVATKVEDNRFTPFYIE